MKEYDWYDKAVEDQHRQREYLGNLSEEEREERQRLIAQLKEPAKKTGEQSMNLSIISRCSDFLHTLHCEKGGCIHGECPVWILERLIACEPLGLCKVCDGQVVISLEKAIEHYQDPNMAIYCCDDCRTAIEGDDDPELDEDSECGMADIDSI